MMENNNISKNEKRIKKIVNLTFEEKYRINPK